jgi:hypothetical protein
VSGAGTTFGVGTINPLVLYRGKGFVLKLGQPHRRSA